MSECIFCQIANGKIPCYKLFEDADVIAFLDASPLTRGHALVIPKEHYETLLACPKDILHKVMDVAQRIGQVDVQLLGAKGVNILSNCYEAAGQSVMHFHVHVIPRYEGEDVKALEFNKTSDEKLNLPVIAEKIKERLG